MQVHTQMCTMIEGGTLQDLTAHEQWCQKYVQIKKGYKHTEYTIATTRDRGFFFCFSFHGNFYIVKEQSGNK